MDKLRAAWASVTPLRTDYAAIVAEIHAAQVMGDASCFTRGPHVSITHMGYFKPPNDAFVNELRGKDRRSAKEWEYINGEGVWIEVALFALDMVRNVDDPEQSCRQLGIAEMGCAAAMEVLSMRAQ